MNGCAYRAAMATQGWLWASHSFRRMRPTGVSYCAQTPPGPKGIIDPTKVVRTALQDAAS
jgi:hypothetical protein